MRFLAPLCVFVLCAAPRLGAQEPQLPSGVPVALADRVRDEVAERWSVPAESIVVEISPPRAGRPLAGEGSFELLGSGSGGHWVLRAEAEDGGVPVSLRIRAGLWTKTSVAARRIERGEGIAAADMREVERVRWGVPLPTAEAVAEGWVAQRLIREGETLSEPAVQPPVAVRSGEPVELVWSRGGVGIRAPGRAAGTGAVGRRIYVRTMSGTRLVGVVVAQGLVNVTQGGSEG